MSFTRPGKHPLRYGVSRPSHYSGRDMESNSMIGSRYKGAGSTDTEMPTKYDDKPWTPFALLEGADALYRIALAFMAAWQLCRHTEFWDGQWNTLFGIQLGLSVFFWMNVLWMFFWNGYERVKNATAGGKKAIARDENGQVIYSDPEAEKMLPEIRCGLLYMTARAAIDGVVYWCIFEWWDANKSRSLDCVDQRRLDRNMWLVLLTAVAFSLEAISYFLNFCVYLIRKAAGGKFELYYDL